MAAFYRTPCGAVLWLLALAALVLPCVGRGAQVSYRADAPVAGASHVDYYTDAHGTLQIEQLLAAPDRYLRPLHRRSINFGFSNAVYWLHWSLSSRASAPTLAFLSIAQPKLGDLRLYVVEHGVVTQRVMAGDLLPMSRQQVAADHPVLPIRVAPRGHYELYLRVASPTGAMLVPLQLESAADLQSSQRASLLINGIVGGAFVGLFIYNLLLYASLRKRAYLFYVLLLPSTYLACSVLDGFGAWMLYPTHVWPSDRGLALFAGVSFALSMLFARALLETRSVRWLDRLLLAVAALGAVTAGCCELLPSALLYRLIALLVLVSPLCGAAAGVIGVRRAHPQARFYLLAQASTWSAMCFFALSAEGIIGFSQLARQGVAFGITTNALLLSLALADRIRALQRSTERAESSARETLERRQQELERIVAERTQELEQARRHAEHLATTDALTGIYNRRGLLPLVQQAIEQAKEQGTSLTLICFDLDYFKHINDDFGHPEGDRVLCDLVAQTRKHVRQSDLLGRTGGEEFMLALGAPLASAVQRAEALRMHLQQQLKTGSGQRAVTASFGIAALGPLFHSLETLQQAADAALYRAKRRGRNRVEVYSENEEATLRSRVVVRGAFGSSVRLRTPQVPG